MGVGGCFDSNKEGLQDKLVITRTKKMNGLEWKERVTMSMAKDSNGKVNGSYKKEKLDKNGRVTKTTTMELRENKIILNKPLKVKEKDGEKVVNEIELSEEDVKLMGKDTRMAPEAPEEGKVRTRRGRGNGNQVHITNDGHEYEVNSKGKVVSLSLGKRVKTRSKSGQRAEIRAKQQFIYDDKGRLVKCVS